MDGVYFLKNNGIDVESALEFLGDIETYEETLEDFVDEAYEKIKRIKDAKEKGDLRAYEIDVHSLKSDSKYLGFEKLAELSLNHEMKAKANDAHYINLHFEELMNEANRILNTVKEYLITNGEEEKKEEIEEIFTEPITKKTDDDLTIELFSPVKHEKKTLLVVDDSNIVSHFIQKIFNDEFNVAVATDGTEALRVITNVDTNNLEGMLLDLNMPNVDGFEVLNFMKSRDLFEKIPTVIITGLSEAEIREQVKEYPIVDLLIKPFNAEKIKKVVDEIRKN